MLHCVDAAAAAQAPGWVGRVCHQLFRLLVRLNGVGRGANPVDITHFVMFRMLDVSLGGALPPGLPPLSVLRSTNAVLSDKRVIATALGLLLICCTSNSWSLLLPSFSKGLTPKLDYCLHLLQQLLGLLLHLMGLQQIGVTPSLPGAMFLTAVAVTVLLLDIHVTAVVKAVVDVVSGLIAASTRCVIQPV